MTSPITDVAALDADTAEAVRARLGVEYGPRIGTRRGVGGKCVKRVEPGLRARGGDAGGDGYLAAPDRDVQRGVGRHP